MKTILLTGASGFVGRQIARALLAQGHSLKLVLRPGGLERSGLSSDDITVIETADLFAEGAGWWEQHLQDVDAVIHSAWYVEPGKYLESPRNRDCAEGTLRLAEGAIAAGIAHFIGIGTCFEYQLPNAAITADSSLGPVTPYAIAKRDVYLALKKRFEESGTAFTWARLFYLFGEGEHPARLFPMLHLKLAAGEPVQLSSGDKIRDFLDVVEAGELIATLADTGQTGVANVCSGRAVTIRDVALEIADLYGRRDLLEFGSATLHPNDPAAVAGACNIRRR